MTTLAELSRAHGWLAAMRPLPSDVTEELRPRYEVAFTHHSTAIEGNTLTQSEIQIILEKGITIGGKTLIEHLEVVGHKHALDFVLQLTEEAPPLGEREIREIHSLVMKDQGNGDVGRYRSLDVKAAGTDYIYPSHLKVQELMDSFVAWLAHPHGSHPVEYATEAHLRFVTIHPFRDGNCRVGRRLLNLLLLRHGYPIAVLLTSQRAEYIAALESCQTLGTRDALDALVREAVARSLRDTLQTALSSASLVVPGDVRSEASAWIRGGDP